MHWEHYYMPNVTAANATFTQDLKSACMLCGLDAISAESF